MNAVALPVVAGPTAMPIPSGEGSPSETSSFGALVAAVAKGEDQQAAETSETLDDATSSPDVMSDVPPAFVVRQWLAQTDSPPSFSQGLISVLERFGGNSQESTPASEPEDETSSDGADAPVLPATQEAMGSESKPDQVDSRDVPTAVVLPAQFSIRRPETSGISSSALVSDPLDGQAPAPLARQPFQPISESPLGDRFDGTDKPTPDSSKPSTASADETKGTAPDQRQSGDNPKPAESNSSLLHAARGPETPAQLAATSTANPPNTPPQTSDGSSIAPAITNMPSAANSSADEPVKFVLATRAGQQTPELQTLALHIAARSARGDSRFTIRLDPPALGRIDVNLSVNSHGHAQAVLAVEKPQTLELLLRDAPTLERALKDAGLELGSNLSFSLKEEGRPHFASDEHDKRPARTVELLPAEATNIRSPLRSSVIENLYGLRIARLDITV